MNPINKYTTEHEVFCYECNKNETAVPAKIPDCIFKERYRRNPEHTIDSLLYYLVLNDKMGDIDNFLKPIFRKYQNLLSEMGKTIYLEDIQNFLQNIRDPLCAEIIFACFRTISQYPELNEVRVNHAMEKLANLTIFPYRSLNEIPKNRFMVVKDNSIHLQVDPNIFGVVLRAPYNSSANASLQSSDRGKKLEFVPAHLSPNVEVRNWSLASFPSATIPPRANPRTPVIVSPVSDVASSSEPLPRSDGRAPA